MTLIAVAVVLLLAPYAYICASFALRESRTAPLPGWVRVAYGLLALSCCGLMVWVMVGGGG